MRPRPALNIDVNRACCTFETAGELLQAARALCSDDHLLLARAKNGFALSEDKVGACTCARAFRCRTGRAGQSGRV